jgi:hypothetical protein
MSTFTPWSTRTVRPNGRSSSSYSSMSPVSALFWHADGTGDASKRDNKRACLRPRPRNRSTKITGQRPRHHKITRPPASSARAAPPIHSGASTHHHDQVTTPTSLSAMSVITAACSSEPTTSEAPCGRCTRILATPASVVMRRGSAGGSARPDACHLTVGDLVVGLAAVAAPERSLCALPLRSRLVHSWRRASRYARRVSTSPG